MPTSQKSTRAPTIVIVGRPNVGKSTLFNRLLGSRRAIVGDEPGITRDRLYGEANWRGRDLRLVDTGGIVPGQTELIPGEIFRQAQVALAEADVVVLVVDGRSELSAPDLELARLLRKIGKPVLVAVNKADSSKQDHLSHDFYQLGIPAMVPVSAEHGRGVDELLDSILDVLRIEQALLPPDRTSTVAPAEPRANRGVGEASTEEEQLPLVRVAIIGHPNVGKSTLLNRLTGIDRAIVSPIPGTTRDAVDETVEHHGKRFCFVDTAGIRRKGKTHLMAEKLSVVMARKHLEAADIAILVIDASEGVTALDAVIGGYAHESGRSVIIVVNKWDLIVSGKKRAISRARVARIQESKHPHDRASYEQRLRRALKFLNYAPVLFISAATGEGTQKILATLEQVAAERAKRITTAQMNRFLEHIDFSRASVPARRQVKILYVTQVATAPPTFVLFTDRKVKLHFSYERFLENQIRRAFGFLGTPIWIKVRARI
ncbi:MAG: ribosome biogenesis GTPase Der [Acidobacteria bacterium]|nr:ribosome biogenesis GTPase Der [Acidobacteriota bacterium]